MIIERTYAHLSSYDEETWPWSVPCVRQLLNEGLRFTAPVTFLVGENGSGKSTLVEALAEGFGLDSYGGSHDWRYASPRGKSTLGERMKFDAASGRGRRQLCCVVTSTDPQLRARRSPPEPVERGGP